MITMPCCGHHGRLGNFMFQFAAGYALAKRTGQEFVIPSSDYTQYLGNLPRWVKITDQLPHQPNHYEEPHFSYKAIPADLRNASIRGYFQSIKFWEDEAWDIWCSFVGHDMSTQGIDALVRRHCMADDAVALCVRRTDYLHSNDFHSVLDMDYYGPAMEMFPDKEFVVFSDDLSWCRTKFLGDRFHFCEEKDHWLKLWMIAACQGGAIIAASTFHFWGAWLGWYVNEQSVVWPRRWFGSRGPNDQTNDICPKEWTRL